MDKNKDILYKIDQIVQRSINFSRLRLFLWQCLRDKCPAAKYCYYGFNNPTILVLFELYSPFVVLYFIY